MSKAHITINPTTKCTMNCFYCHAPQEQHKTLSFEQLQHGLDFIANEIPEIEKWKIHFNSHDVLLCWDNLVKPCIQLYSNHNIKFSLHTNGVLLTQDKIEFLKEHNVLLMMSLDGPKYVQDINRKFKNGTSSYDFVMKKLELLQSFNYSISLISTLNDKSISYLYNCYQYFIEKNYLFTFLFDIKYSKYDKNYLKKIFNQVAVNFAQQPENKQEQFRMYYRSIHRNNKEYRLVINTNNISAMINKHSFSRIAYFEDNTIQRVNNKNTLYPVQGTRCAHNKIRCLKCPAFNGEFSNFPKFNMEIYCLFLQELFSEIKKVKGERYFDLSKNLV